MTEGAKKDSSYGVWRVCWDCERDMPDLDVNVLRRWNWVVIDGQWVCPVCADRRLAQKTHQP